MAYLDTCPDCPDRTLVAPLAVSTAGPEQLVADYLCPAGHTWHTGWAAQPEQESTMPETYGEVIIQSERSVVTRHDPITLVTVELLAEAPDLIAAADRIHIGFNTDGDAVHYRIVGWDAEAKALIAHRETPPLTPDEAQAVLGR